MNWQDGKQWDDGMRRNCIPFNEIEIDLYRLWWEFLKVSDWNKRDKWNKQVQIDFQDITASAAPNSARENFEAWWAEHSHLFWRPKKPLKLLVVTDHADFEQKSQPGHMIIALPLTENPAQLCKEFSQLLSANSQYIESSTKTIPISSPSTTSKGRYAIFQANLESLPRRDLVMKALFAHQLYAERICQHDDALKIYNAGLSRLQGEIDDLRANKKQLIKTIGKDIASKRIYDAKKQLQMFKKKKIRPKQIWQMLEDFHSRRKASGEQTIILEASKMPRYRTYAKNIIINVQQGIFPKHT